MPYSGPSDPKLPENIKDRSLSIRKQWVAVWNSKYTDCLAEGGSVETCEGEAFEMANGVIRNTTPTIRSKLITLAAVSAGLVKERQHTDGKRYLVAPTIAIVEGVMNETLYLEEEIAAFIDAWNGRPLIINHPEEDGEFVTANNPDLLPRVLGFYYNASFENERLKGEWWLDIAKAQKTPEGLAILTGLQSGKLFEQSTGLFADLQEHEGEFKGKEYKWIARNIRPDHVAILPNEPGACSIEDGCGTPRVNSQEGAEDPASLPNEQGVLLELNSVTNTLKGYSENLSKFFKKFKLFNASLEDNQMNREELVDWIMQNSPIPMTAAMLESATDEELQAIADSIIPASEPAALTEAGPEDNPAANDGDILFTVPSATSPMPLPGPQQPAPAPVLAEGAGQEPVEGAAPPGGGFLSSLPTEAAELIQMLSELGGVKALRELIEQAREAQLGQFDALADILVTNGNYSREDLENVSIPLLTQMVANLASAPSALSPSAGGVYGGRMFGVNEAQPTTDWEVYTGPEGGQ